MNVVIVEDETELREKLERVFRGEGWTSLACSSAEEAHALISLRSFSPDIAVLDRMLDGHDGIDLIAPLKKTFPGVRIFVLSAIDTPIEKANALDRGADDYLAKPFSSVELLARVRALARRPGSSTTANSLFTLGNIILDPVSRNLTVDGQRHALPNKEFFLLHVLMRQPGRVIGKVALFEEVWDIKAELETNVLESTITNLRRRLADAGANVKIRNLRNTGYWIEA